MRLPRRAYNVGMADKQCIVHFSGNVQGVGFRYTACRVAQGYNVTGTVRNLPDGRVECIAEGEAAQIEAFLRELSDQMDSYIRSQCRQTAPHSGRFKSFGVSF
ncbi:MAG: acylphosphatase [Planctomycetota bacterium]|nr:acylphosphatase [Planctomycetota bacterium]